MIQTDVLIIGAGPAGSEAAYRLSRMGYSVIVLEKQALDREKPCGGALALGELMEFGEPPPEVVERRVSCARVFGPDDSRLDLLIRREQFNGIIVKRSVYDRWLQRRADQARFIPHASLEGLQRRGGRWLASVETPEGRFSLSARLLLHAAGAAASGLERMLGLAPMPRRDMGVAVQQWLQLGSEALDRAFGDSIELHFLPQRVPDGYFWLFPKRDVLVAGVGASLPSLKSHVRALDKELEDFIARRLRQLDLPLDCPRPRRDAGKVPAGLRRPVQGDGFMLLGDAAGLCSHIHGGGIFQARKSALFAAEQGDRYLRGDAGAPADYEQQLHRHFTEYEGKWDRRLKPMLSDERMLPRILQRGQRDDSLREALGILFGTPTSHSQAYELIEQAVFPLLAETLDACTRPERELIEQALQSVFVDDTQLQRVANSSLLAQGRRLRPVLMLLVGRALGASTEGLLPSALAYELTQTASLIHDDIIDGGEVRRGSPTAHCRFGLGPAIVAGDALIIKGFEMLARVGDNPAVDKQTLLRLLRLGCASGLVTAEGEMRDMGFRPEQVADLEVEDYLEMVRAKTAALIAASTEAGAILAGADERTIAAMRDFGDELGVAFQIIDDLKDILSPVSSSLKSRHTDIREGKLTAPFILCAKRADDSDRQWLIEQLSSGSAEQWEGVLAMYRKYAVIEACQRLMKVHLDRAMDRLDGLPPSAERDKLQEILQAFRCCTLSAEGDYPTAG